MFVVGEYTCDAGRGITDPAQFWRPQDHLQTEAGSARIADETWEQQTRNTLLSVTK